MLKAQNKENEQQQQQITKKMNASEVKEYKEDEDEDEDKSNNPLCENRELSGWFFKKGELLNSGTRDTFLLTRKDERFLFTPLLRLSRRRNRRQS